MMMLRALVASASAIGIIMAMSHDVVGATNSEPMRDVSVVDPAA